jgi:hypothetical protein
MCIMIKLKIFLLYWCYKYGFLTGFGLHTNQLNSSYLYAFNQIRNIIIIILLIQVCLICFAFEGNYQERLKKDTFK